MTAPPLRSKPWTLAGSFALLSFNACYLSFEDYPVGDLCKAGRQVPVAERDSPIRNCQAGDSASADGGALQEQPHDDTGGTLGIGGNQ
jgi:hypothetical protein